MKNVKTFGEFINESINEAAVKSPKWFSSLETQLSDMLDIEVIDLALEIVHNNLIKVGTDFSQQGLDNFPKVIRELLRTPEFKGKMQFLNTEKSGDAVVKKYPELEDEISNEEFFWIYIK